MTVSGLHCDDNGTGERRGCDRKVSGKKMSFSSENPFHWEKERERDRIPWGALENQTQGSPRILISERRDHTGCVNGRIRTQWLEKWFWDIHPGSFTFHSCNVKNLGQHQRSHEASNLIWNQTNSYAFPAQMLKRKANRSLKIGKM